MARILIIDQDSHIRRFIRQVLERTGYSVAEAATPAEAAAQLAACPPDILILDCLLGGYGRGLDLLQTIRCDPQWRAIPVLLTTTMPDAEIDTRLRNCGASAFLLKPFGPRDLVQAVALAGGIAPRGEPGAPIAS